MRKVATSHLTLIETHRVVSDLAIVTMLERVHAIAHALGFDTRSTRTPRVSP